MMLRTDRRGVRGGGTASTSGYGGQLVFRIDRLSGRPATSNIATALGFGPAVTQF